MFTARTLASSAACCILLLSASYPALAQKPVWTPIAELLVGSLGESDPVRMSDVLTRCTALNMTLAGLATDISADMAQHYRDEAHRLIQHSVLIDSQLERDATGNDVDLSAMSITTIAKVKDLLTGYNLWLDANHASAGSYFNKDIDLEIDSCLLASKLISQMQ